MFLFFFRRLKNYRIERKQINGEKAETTQGHIASPPGAEATTGLRGQRTQTENMGCSQQRKTHRTKKPHPDPKKKQYTHPKNGWCKTKVYIDYLFVVDSIILESVPLYDMPDQIILYYIVLSSIVICSKILSSFRLYYLIGSVCDSHSAMDPCRTRTRSVKGPYSGARIGSVWVPHDAFFRLHRIVFLHSQSPLQESTPHRLRHATDRVVFTQSVSAIECITMIVLVLYYIIIVVELISYATPLTAQFLHSQCLQQNVLLSLYQYYIILLLQQYQIIIVCILYYHCNRII